MKKSVVIFMIVVFCLTSTTLVFADVAKLTKESNQKENLEEYKINSVTELKKELDSLGNDEIKMDEAKKLSAETAPHVIKAFIKEKQKKADELLNGTGDLIIESNQQHYEKTYDLGDNCWIKFTIDEERVPTIYEKVKDFLIPTAYAFSKSGYKTGWQDYGNYKYTAAATANYAVAAGTYRLQVYYTLSSAGIKVTDEIATAIDETLLTIDVKKVETTDDVATKPGASDCNTYAVFKSSYGYDPFDWTRTHKMDLNIKYLAKDATGKQIHNTREWSISPYNPS